MSLQKESEWVQKFQEKIEENKFVTPSSHLAVQEIKSFIEYAITTREKEIAEEVRNLQKGKDHTGNECTFLYVPADAVLQLLKH